MKTLIFLGACLCCLAVGQYGYSNACCAPAAEPVCEQPTGETYSLYVSYEPCYSTSKRCVEKQVPCTKKCYRKVPKYYEVQRCKMVPQYYSETCCKYETECYEVADSRCCKEWVTDTHCQYVPKYSWKHTCGQDIQPPAAQTIPGCPSAPAPVGCASGSCGVR